MQRLWQGLQKLCFLLLIVAVGGLVMLTITHWQTVWKQIADNLTSVSYAYGQFDHWYLVFIMIGGVALLGLVWVHRHP